MYQHTMIFQPVKTNLRETLETIRLSAKEALGLGSLPDFYIIGAQKSGTSSLYDCLCQHPGVIHRIKKEIHFFNNPSRRCRGLSFYKAHFSTLTKRRRIAKEIGYLPLEGEATPFIIHPWVAKWVRDTRPNAKLILIVRNPIDRALSHYYHNKRRGRENLSFEEAIQCESERISLDLDRLIKDPNYSGNAYLSFSYLTRGYYDNQLEQWLKFFPLEQICIISFEDFVENQQKTVSKVFRFLGLPDFEISKSFKSNRGNYADRLKQELRDWLFEHFYSHNQRFFEIISQDFGWNIE